MEKILCLQVSSDFEKNNFGRKVAFTDVNTFK